MCYFLDFAGITIKLADISVGCNCRRRLHFFLIFFFYFFSRWSIIAGAALNGRRQDRRPFGPLESEDKPMAECMAELSVFLELNKAQLDVIARVFKSACPVVQLTARHRTDPVLLYGIFPHGKAPNDVHSLYAVEIPEKPGHVGVYLTAAQKAELQRARIPSCDYVEVEPIGLKYGIVMPPMVRYGMAVPPSSVPGK